MVTRDSASSSRCAFWAACASTWAKLAHQLFVTLLQRAGLGLGALDLLPQCRNRSVHNEQSFSYVLSLLDQPIPFRTNLIVLGLRDIQLFLQRIRGSGRLLAITGQFLQTARVTSAEHGHLGLHPRQRNPPCLGPELQNGFLKRRGH